MNIQDRRKTLTVEELRRRYNLDSLDKDRKAIKMAKEQLNKVDSELNNFVEITTKNIKELQQELIDKIEKYFYEFILTNHNDSMESYKQVGMNYIKFAIDERNLFRFLFQSNEFSGIDMLDLLESEELLPILTVLQSELDMSMEDTKGVFSTLFIFAHGYASLYANNTMVYDERNVMKALENIFFGAIYSVKGEQNEKNN